MTILVVNTIDVALLTKYALPIREEEMVYLVRTSEMTGDWEKAWATLTDIIEYVGQNYDQVKDSFLMTNIAGPTGKVHWVLSFETLANALNSRNLDAVDDVFAPDYVRHDPPDYRHLPHRERPDCRELACVSRVGALANTDSGDPGSGGSGAENRDLFR
jgi:hypothetical protein